MHPFGHIVRRALKLESRDLMRKKYPLLNIERDFGHMEIALSTKGLTGQNNVKETLRRRSASNKRGRNSARKVKIVALDNRKVAFVSYNKAGLKD